MDDSVSQQLKNFGINNQAEDLKTSSGRPVDTITASLSTGPHGVIPFADFTFLDHISAFDRERVPERVVHAKGSGAFGYFEVTSDEIKKYCKSAMFDSIGKRTPMAVRFSQFAGESGSADSVRDPRGFALKFYTEEGNWDLVGNNTPIFFIRDPILFPSFAHSQKRHPATHCRDPNAFWDFLSLRPESTHQTTFLFSDRGIPLGYRHMNGYGSHTFQTINEANEVFYVKWHFKTNQGIQNMDVAEAARLAGEDPDFFTRDLFNAIASGDFPTWTACFQVMCVADVKKCSFDPFDVTKVWPHSQFPLHEFGRFILNRNPTNYFAEVEQLGFDPAHMIPGIEASPDKLLQGRLFSYGDTLRYRLGVNYNTIPVNCPYTARPVHTYQRDGSMCVDNNQGDQPNYYPNSFNGPAPTTTTTTTSAATTTNTTITNTTSTTTDGVSEQSTQTNGHPSESNLAHYEIKSDDFTQAGVFYRNVLNTEERERLTDNIAQHLSGAYEFIQDRAVTNFTTVDEHYGSAVRNKLDQIKQGNGMNKKVEQVYKKHNYLTSTVCDRSMSANF